MLLIVFVENAFKHLSTATEKKNNVIVSLHGEEDRIIFKCVNTISNVHSLENDLEKGRSGIGLVNARKRLALLYPDTHTLQIEKQEETYSVHLTLDI